MKVWSEGIGRDHEEYLPPAASGEPICYARSAQYHNCTRDKGHPGDHAAHGHHEQLFARWARTEEPK